MRELRTVYVEPEVDVGYEGPKIRKIIFARHSLGAIKILKADGSTQVNAYNFANYLYPYTLSTSEQTRLEHPLGAARTVDHRNAYYLLYIKALFGMDDSDNMPSRRYMTLWVAPVYTPLRVTQWSHPDEANRDVEEIDKFFWIPPVETGEHRSARLQDELTHVARVGIEKLLLLNDIPDLLAGYSSYTGNASSSYSTFLRNAITSFKACIGYLQSKLTANAIDATTEKAIYDLYELFHTIHTRDESGSGIDFYSMVFDLSAASDWDGAYSGKLCRMPNADGTGGRVLRDVNAANTTAGVVDVAAASVEYRAYARENFQTAYTHTDQNHGLAEELHIEEYMPLGRNTNLTTLKLWISDTPSGAGLNFTETFDSDVLAYTASRTWGGRETIFVEALSENPNATITGAGLVTTTIGVNEIIITVTSQDTLATKTYTITTERLS